MSEVFDAILRPLRALPAWVSVTAPFQLKSRAESLPGSMDDIASYHRRRSDTTGVVLSDRTWGDLELDGVFRKADHCESAVGQQVLYDLLRRPDISPTEIARRDTLVRSMDSDAATREHVRGALAKLKTRSTYYLYRLFEEELPTRPRLFFIFPLLGFTSVIGILTLLISPGAGLWILIVAICVNLGIKLYYRPRFEHLIQPIMALRNLVLAAEALANHEFSDLRACTGDLASRCDRLRWINGAARRLVVEDSSNELVGSLAAWTNLFFLLDVNAFVLSIERLRRSRDDLRAVFRGVGTVDALCAIGAFRRALIHWSAPDFGPAAKSIRSEGLYHPIVADAVANDCHVNDRPLLITGSNMAGKSTYLRAVGTCAVLAQTLATVPAKSWVAPILRVETVIGRTDDLTDGKSYFFAEAERVKDILDLAAGDSLCLFVIDELYRGTNTRERVSAAHAVLAQLDASGHICLVATHDVELLELLGDQWDSRHFRETIDETGVLFDYRIRVGPAITPNALRLLQRLDYPPQVVRRAYDTYAVLARSSDDA